MAADLQWLHRLQEQVHAHRHPGSTHPKHDPKHPDPKHHDPKKHGKPKRRVTVSHGGSGKQMPGMSGKQSAWIRAYNEGLAAEDRRRRLAIGELIEVVSSGMSTFSFYFTEGARALLDSLKRHSPSIGGGSHGGQHEYKRDWIMRQILGDNVGSHSRLDDDLKRY